MSGEILTQVCVVCALVFIIVLYEFAVSRECVSISLTVGGSMQISTS